LRTHLKIPLLFIAFILFLLASCAPTNYVYTKPINQERHGIKHVLIMVEYLNAKDDIKGFWNFDEDINLSNQDALYDLASQMLISKGYLLSNKILKTSGLVMARDFYMDHYVDKQLQDEAISPPYIVRSVNLEDENIQGLEYLLAELNRPMSSVMTDYRGFVHNNYKQQSTSIGLSNDTAILLIQSYKPRVNLFENVTIDYSVTSSGGGSGVGLSKRAPRASSQAYLIHVGSGDLLWSNKTSLIKLSNQEKFFKELPLN
jgi:hypothetical protein